MTQEHFESVTATLAAALLPVMCAQGHPMNTQLETVAKTAAIFAKAVIGEARKAFQANDGVM